MSAQASETLDHGDSSSQVARCDAAAAAATAQGSQQSGAGHRPWLQWIMAMLQTTPEKLSERHSNMWFTLFLALCFPAMVAGMLVCVLGWGTDWHPFWYFVMIVYALNIIWAPFLLRYSEETIMKKSITRFWCQTVMTIAILFYVIGMMLSGTSKVFVAWLPFGDVSLTTLANYFQVPGMMMSEHVLFVHNPRPSGSVATVVTMYILLGTRLEEARADIVFGSRMIGSARAGHCPYRGGINCLPHFLIAGIIITASAIDYITESLEVHALASIAPHLPLAVKQFRANIIKMTCELATAAAIVVFVLCGMDEYSLVEAAGEAPMFQQAEMRRYAYMCIGTTLLAIAHVLFMLLVPGSAWARVQLQAQAALQAAARRMSVPGLGNAKAGVKATQVAPADPPGQEHVALEIDHGKS